MYLLDKKFAKDKLNYIIQCLLAIISILVVLMIIEPKKNSAIVAAIGASSFIVFTMPKLPQSSPRFLIGGYIVGILSGGLCFFLSNLAFVHNNIYLDHFSCEIFGALAVGLAIFLMVITNTEHPPAASLALGLVINGWQNRTVLIVFCGVLILSLIKRILGPALKDLI